MLIDILNIVSVLWPIKRFVTFWPAHCKNMSWSMNISQEGIIGQRSQNIYDFNEIKIWTDNIIWIALYKLPCTLQKCNDFVIYYIKTRGQFLTLRRDYH